MSQILEFGGKVLADQPFSQLPGTELTAFDKGLAELRDDLCERP